MDVRFHATTETGIAQDSAEATRVIGEIAQRHGLSPTPPNRPFGGSTLIVVPGYTGGAWPGQPDVDWNGGAAWKLSIARPHDIPDTLLCSYMPPRTGNVMKVLFSLDYASRMPAEARPFWDELTTMIVTKYGREALISKEDLR